MLSVAAGAGGTLRSLYERYSEAARRDPREFAVGYLAADGATGAVAPLLWFRDAADLLRFVGTTELGLLRLAPLAHVEVLDALGGMARREPDLERLALRLTVAFHGWTEFLWVGTFGDLCASGSGIPAELRAELRSSRYGRDSDAALAPEEIPQMVELLRALANDRADPPSAATPATPAPRGWLRTVR